MKQKTVAVAVLTLEKETFKMRNIVYKNVSITLDSCLYPINKFADSSKHCVFFCSVTSLWSPAHHSYQRPVFKILATNKWASRVAMTPTLHCPLFVSRAYHIPSNVLSVEFFALAVRHNWHFCFHEDITRTSWMFNFAPSCKKNREC